MPEIINTFGNILAAWTENREKFGPGFYLYVGNRRGMDLFAENEFNNLVFGLEAFHRNLYLQEENVALGNKINRILGTVENHRDRKWLEGRLKSSGEPNLQQRLFEMLHPVQIGTTEKKLQSFTKKCAEFRNDLSHFGQVRTGSAYDEHLEELSYTSRALGYLYHARILQEIGIEPEKVEAIFKSSFHSFQIRYVLWKAGLIDAEAGFQQIGGVNV